MKKQTSEFVVESNNGVVTKISKSSIKQPAVRFRGGTVKWFDDSQLLKKGTQHGK